MKYRYICSIILLSLFMQNAGANCTAAQYRTMAGAAAAAGHQFYRLSLDEDREFMGGILETDGVFTFTVSRGSKRSDTVTARIPVPKDSRLVGFWHTHGSPHYSRHFFSEVDTQLVETMGVPFYLTDPRGTLRVFRPGDKLLSRRQSRKLGLGYMKGNARGKIVKHRCEAT